MYTLLIVDDEYEIRNGLCNYVPWNEIGFEVIGQAENGKQALEFVRSSKVDIILCDILMPIMTGIDLACQLYSSNSNSKIVFLSGHREFEFAQKALTFGVKNYILKPTKYDELIDVFSKLKLELDKENLRNTPSGSLQDKTVTGYNFNDKVISTIKSYVEQNYKDATLDDASELVHMNPFYLSKFFKQKTGQNFSDYVIAVKMKKAAALLNDITYRTYEISYMVGYSNPKNFTRTFRKFFGKSPKEYRSFQH